MADRVSLGGIIAQIDQALTLLEAVEPETPEGAERKQRIIDTLRGFRSTLMEYCDPPPPGEMPQFTQIT